VPEAEEPNSTRLPPLGPRQQHRQELPPAAPAAAQPASWEDLDSTRPPPSGPRLRPGRPTAPSPEAGEQEGADAGDLGNCAGVGGFGEAEVAPCASPSRTPALDMATLAQEMEALRRSHDAMRGELTAERAARESLEKQLAAVLGGACTAAGPASTTALGSLSASTVLELAQFSPGLDSQASVLEEVVPQGTSTAAVAPARVAVEISNELRTMEERWHRLRMETAALRGSLQAWQRQRFAPQACAPRVAAA